MSLICPIAGLRPAAGRAFDAFPALYVADGLVSHVLD